MVRYNYSLDIGESVKTDDKLKEKEKEAPNCGCGAPKEIVKLSDEDKIKEPIEENSEKVEEEILEEIPEPEKKPEPEKEEEKVEIKPISFEKAKLVSDYVEENKKEPASPDSEEDAEEELDEDETEEPEEEDEKDVNEFLEDSFSKEARSYEQYNNQKTKRTTEAPAKRPLWPIILLILLIGAAAFGYGYAIFKEPTAAATVPEQINSAQGIAPIVELQNITENITLPEKKTPEESDVEHSNKTIDQALDYLTLGLKD